MRLRSTIAITKEISVRRRKLPDHPAVELGRDAEQGEAGGAEAEAGAG